VSRLHLDLDLDHVPASAPAARRGVLSFLQESWPDFVSSAVGADLLDDVAIVVSELVGNAVRHGQPPVRVEVVADDDDGHHTVRVACHDSGPWDGTPSRPEGGRGFVLVRGLAAEVSIDADTSHTVVGATLVR
jgi:anti-sigma regulatory factor (Ser/Thr protein kinase)